MYRRILPSVLIIFLTAVIARGDDTAPVLVVNAGGHTGAVRDVLFTPDGSELITVSHDKTIRFWDVRTGEALRTLFPPAGPGREGMLFAAALTPDGATLAVGGKFKGNAIYLISTKTEQIEGRLLGHSEAECVSSLAFSPDGDKLASASCDGTARLWDLESRTTEQIFEGHADGIDEIVFSPDGQFVATCSTDGTARIWSTRSGRLVREMLGHNDEVGCIAWSPDGEMLATGGMESAVRLWRPNGKPLDTVTQAFADLNVHAVKALQFTLDSSELLVSVGTGPNGEESEAFFVNLATGERRGSFAEHDYHIGTAVFSPDGKLVATAGGEEDEIYLRDASELEVFVRLRAGGRHKWGVGWSADETTIAWGDDVNGQLERCFDLVNLEFGNMSSVARSELAVGDTVEVLTDGAKVKVGTKVVGLAKKGAVYRVDRIDGSWLWIQAAARGGEGWIHIRDAVPAPYAKFSRGRTDLGKRSLMPNDRRRRARRTSETHHAHEDPATTNDKLLVYDGEVLTSELILPIRIDAVWATTFIDKDRAAVGSNRGLYVFNTRPGRLVRELVGHTGHVSGLATSPTRRYLLSSSHDQTLRVWDFRSPEPLLSFFAAGDEWIVWTPAGYFAASPAGENLVGWRVSNGPDQMASLYPAASFHKSRYRPDIIKLLLKTGRLDRALEIAGTKTAGTKTAGAGDLEELLPPLVVITEPDRDDIRFDEPTIEVRALARSRRGYPVTSMQLLLDGRPYQHPEAFKQVQQSGTDGEEFSESWSIYLSPGPHRLAVKAATAVSDGMSRERKVEYGPSATPTKPSIHVLAIGVSNAPLMYAHKDAQRICDVFERTRGSLFDKVQVNCLTNKEATRRGVYRGLEWLRKEMIAGDIGVIYFSGHGVRDLDGALYLSPVDFESGEIPGTGVSTDDLRRVLKRLPGRAILLLDACHAGAAGKDVRKSEGDLFRDLVSDDYGVILFASSMAREFSLESREHQGGYFTRAIVEGLSGQADLSPKNGVVYLNELTTYVPTRVKELSDGRQHPVAQKPTSIRDFPLAEVVE